jgi:hypothetical protein
MRSTRPIEQPHEPHGQTSVNQGVAISTRETTSRSLCGLVCPSRTSERGGEGYCVKGGGGEEGERERERTREVRLHYSLEYSG